MSREKPDDKEKGMLKRMRRARGGRTLPRSGAGVHEDKKSKKVERQLAEDADNEIRHWDDPDDEDNYVDQDEWYDWEEYKRSQCPDDDEVEDKEKKDASTD